MNVSDVLKHCKASDCPVSASIPTLNVRFSGKFNMKNFQF